MFYAPKTVASMVAGIDSFELYSDMHKDAIGCRPGEAQYRREAAMSPVERGVEIARLEEWMREGERIDALAAEVGRFRFSQRMEYLLRRGEVQTRLDAFKMTIQLFKRRPYPNDELPSWEECMQDVDFYGWDFLAMDCNLDQKDGAKLKEFWEALNA